MSVGGPIPPLKISPRASAVLGLRALDLAGPLSAIDPQRPENFLYSGRSAWDRARWCGSLRRKRAGPVACRRIQRRQTFL